MDLLDHFREAIGNTESPDQGWTIKTQKRNETALLLGRLSSSLTLAVLIFMKFLGRGWQYTVYDMGNGRVLKRYNTRLQAYSIMLRQCFPYIRNPIWKIPGYHRGCRNTAISSMQKIKETKMDMALFGHPKILNELDYEQDKAVPLRSYFKGLTFDEGKRVIGEFIEFNDILVRNRLIDKSFLIGKNYGIDSRGKIILIDIGELYSAEESIKRQIAKKPWDIFYVTSTIPKRFRRYFVEEMNKYFTS
jgi:hypothetical protein